MEVILPVSREMTIVAAPSSPEIIAREEASTVMGGYCEVGMMLLVGGDESGEGWEALEAMPPMFHKAKQFSFGAMPRVNHCSAHQIDKAMRDDRRLGFARKI